MNTKGLINLLVFQSVVSFLNSQGITFSAEAAFMHNESASQQSINEFNSYSIHIINDSMAIKTSGIFQSINQIDYSSKPGFSFGASLHISLSDRISLKTGLGTEFYSFHGKESYLDSKFIIDRVDTVSYKKNIVDPPFTNCDVFENSIKDLGPVKQGIDYYMLNLMIPLEISYSIIPGRLYIDGGIYLQTPAYSLLSSEHISEDMRTENGKTICKYKIVKVEDNSGSNFRNSQIGLSGTIGYEFEKNLRFNLGVRQTLNNVFFNSNNSYSLITNNYLKPMRFSFGIQYGFGHFVKATILPAN